MGYSPYASMNNNPISNVDPNGDLPWLAIGIAAAVNGIGSGIGSANNGGSFFGGFAKGALIGGATSAATFGVGSAFGSVGSFANELGKAGAHGIIGGLNSHFSGGGFGSGFLSGGISSGFGSAFNGSSGFGSYVGGGLSGGFASLAGGGNFLFGAGQGVLTTAFNHRQHGNGCPDCPMKVTGPQVTISASRIVNPQGGTTLYAGSIIGAGLNAAGGLQSSNGYWRGIDGRYYSNDWGGNGFKFKYSAGTRAYAQFSSQALNYTGNSLAIANYGYTVYQYTQNQVSTPTLVGEGVSTGVTMAAPFPYNVAWGIGWEGGRFITSRRWYTRFVWGEGGRDGLISTPK